MIEQREKQRSERQRKGRSGRSLAQRGAIAAAAILAGIVTIGSSGVVSAQAVVADEPTAAQQTHVEGAQQTHVEGAQQTHVEGAQQTHVEGEGHGEDSSLTTEDEAVFKQFEQCLDDAGLSGDDADADHGDVEFADADSEAALDAAFEQCDPILDDLSDDFIVMGHDLSDEDVAVFDRYDACLEGAGIDWDADDLEDDWDEAALDAAFEQCDPILDDLSEELQEEFGDVGISDEDEAIFDRYDQCVTDAAVDWEAEHLDDVDVNALEACESILDDLSDELQAEFEFIAEDEAVLEKFDACLEGAGIDWEAEDIDETIIDAAFEQCDPILDELSAETQEVFAD